MSDSICYKVHDRNGDLVTSGFEDILTFNWYTKGDKSDIGKVWVEPAFQHTLSIDTGYGVIKEMVDGLKKIVIELCALVPNPEKPDFTLALSNGNSADDECLRTALQTARDLLAKLEGEL